MEKKKECEIVQDLLLGYIDDVLNEESKRLVEKHLIECEGCQRKLKEIKTDINETEKSQQKEIDYLKKIRRKSKIKSLLIVLGIIILFLLMLYLIKFIKVNDFMNKAKISLQSDNIYKETRQIVDDNKVWILKEYYKDGKYKSVDELYTEEGIKTKTTMYAEEGTDVIYTISEDENIVKVQKGKFAEFKNKSLINVPFVGNRQNLFAILGTAYIMSIETDNYDVGREYYVLKNQFENVQRWEIWIDKETGLPIREINKNASKEFFIGTDIVKSVRDNTQEFKYEFNIVTDADVTIPDFSNYEVEYVKSEEIDKIFEN